MSPLDDYERKRDFARTPEPRGDVTSGRGDPRFVIQQHDATTMHYDFRLEVDGVGRSWAVPKGPSTNPKEKRLALPTEDHPLGYFDFEGVIPRGNYGAGPVIVWDAGTYRNLKDDKSMAQALADGHATFWLDGKKLKGGYALTSFREDSWLLVKMDDEEADARRNPVSTQPESVTSGRTIDELREVDA